MSLFVNGTEITSVICNGVELTEVWANGVLVYEFADEPEPFWIQPTENTTVKFKATRGSPNISKAMKYSTDATNWTSITLADFRATGVSATANQKLYIASDDSVAFATSSSAVGLDVDNGDFDIGGDAEWLFNQTSSLPSRGMERFFYRNTHIRSARKLNLPNCDTSYCCTYMFAESSLITPMRALSTTLGANCYNSMFRKCANITTAPQLPAMALKPSCYSYMFAESGLITAPQLPATDGSDSSMAYNYMFSNCDSLTTIPAVHLTSFGSSCAYSIFRNCDALKFSTTQTASYPNPYRFPASGTATGNNSAIFGAFLETTGTFKGSTDEFDTPLTPALNTTYYTNATVV